MRAARRLCPARIPHPAQVALSLFALRLAASTAASAPVLNRRTTSHGAARWPAARQARAVVRGPRTRGTSRPDRRRCPRRVRGASTCRDESGQRDERRAAHPGPAAASTSRPRSISPGSRSAAKLVRIPLRPACCSRNVGAGCGKAPVLSLIHCFSRVNHCRKFACERGIGKFFEPASRPGLDPSFPSAPSGSEFGGAAAAPGVRG